MHTGHALAEIRAEVLQVAGDHVIGTRFDRRKQNRDVLYGQPHRRWQRLGARFIDDANTLDEPVQPRALLRCANVPIGFSNRIRRREEHGLSKLPKRERAILRLPRGRDQHVCVEEDPIAHDRGGGV